MQREAEQVAERVLVLAPIGRDAQAAAQQIAENKLKYAICSGLDDLYENY